MDLKTVYITLILSLATSLLFLNTVAGKKKSRKDLQEEIDQDFENELHITSKEKLLAKKLITRYDRMGKEGRPVVNTSDAIRVEFGLSLIQILDVDIKDQVLKTNVWYEYNWEDVLLRWNKEDYENISEVRIPSDKIWLPDILLYNFADDRLKEQRSALAVIESDGKVLWMPQAILRSSCFFDTLYFPLDEQTCTLKFGSWSYSGLKVDIHFIKDREKFDLGSYINNQEWDIIENTGKRFVEQYTCCPEYYPDLKFRLRLRRKVAFYTFILIMPCALLSLLTMVIFWVPPESPAKLTLGMSIFLAFFVLLLLLAKSTPKASSNIPLIGVYFCMNMIMITVSEMLACVIANMHFRGVRINRVPKCLRVVMIDYLSRVLCLFDNIMEKDRASSTPGTAVPPKKRWTAGRVGGDNKPQYPYTDMTFAQVRLMDNGVENKRYDGVDGNGGQGIGMDSRNGSGNTGGFQFPPIGDEYLAHSQANAQVLEEIRYIRDIMERMKEKRARLEEKERMTREWRTVSIVFDRIIFIIYVLIIVVGLLAMFSIYINREPNLSYGMN